MTKPRALATHGLEGLDLRPIQAVHRHTDSFVRFSHEVRGEMRNLAFVRVADLAQWFPAFRNELLTDSYYSLNSFDKRRGRSGDVLCLNAAYADLDFYHSGLDRGDAQSLIAKAEDRGLIPPASMLVFSGRGLWLLWLLVDGPNHDMPLLVDSRNPEPRRLYRLTQERILQSIGHTLSQLHPDHQGKDAARMLRVPGSINTKPLIPATVEYQIQGRGGTGITYTLNELASAFGLELPEPGALVLRQPDKAGPVTRVPGRSRGFRSLQLGRLADIETLITLRGGGFTLGCRNRAAFLYACTLRACGHQFGEVYQRVHELAVRCTPPLSTSDTRKAIKQAHSARYYWRDATIVNDLGITEDELRHLQHIDPNRPHRKPGRPTEARKGPRQERVEAIIRAGGQGLTHRRLAARLQAEGFPVTHTTVKRDLDALYEAHPELKPKPPLPFAEADAPSEG